MKINNPVGEKMVMFNELSHGDTFIAAWSPDTVLIKIDTFFNERTYNAVDLNFGFPIFIEKNELVTPVQITATASI